MIDTKRVKVEIEPVAIFFFLISLNASTHTCLLFVSLYSSRITHTQRAYRRGAVKKDEEAAAKCLTGRYKAGQITVSRAHTRIRNKATDLSPFSHSFANTLLTPQIRTNDRVAILKKGTVHLCKIETYWNILKLCTIKIVIACVFFKLQNWKKI